MSKSLKSPGATNPLRICLWSGPRNVSTALMYSFAQRSDTRILDEPLYAHYLSVTGVEHPGKVEILAALENDGRRVVRELILGPCDRPVLFMKQMTNHLVGLDWDFMRHTVNVLLVRDPLQVIPSLAKGIVIIGLRDVALATQVELLQQLRAWGQDPPVLDAKHLLLDPPGVLRRLCSHVGIAFEESMLRWKSGPHPEDGVWARYWYQNAHLSTGFEPFRERSEPFPAHLMPLLEESRKYYELLSSIAIKTDIVGAAADGYEERGGVKGNSEINEKLL
jgi:Sulfotransferase domain